MSALLLSALAGLWTYTVSSCRQEACITAGPQLLKDTHHSAMLSPTHLAWVVSTGPHACKNRCMYRLNMHASHVVDGHLKQSTNKYADPDAVPTSSIPDPRLCKNHRMHGPTHNTANDILKRTKCASYYDHRRCYELMRFPALARCVQ